MPTFRSLATVALVLIVAATVAYAADNSAPTKTAGKPVTTKSGLKYWELKKGSGAVAKTGDSVKTGFRGRTEEGRGCGLRKASSR